MKRSTLFLMMTLAALPAAASAQSASAAANGAANAQAGDPEARIAAVMGAAAKAEIPRSLLESKLEEGRAKGVAMERIAAAMEARLNGLLRAQTALQESGVTAVSEGELLVASEALTAGVSQTALAEVMAGSPGERRAVAAAVLTDLVRLGYGSPEAVVRLNGALSSGPEALVNLRAEAAASLRARGLLSTPVSGGNGRPF